MRINLLLVFLLQAKVDSHGDNSFLRSFNLGQQRLQRTDVRHLVKQVSESVIRAPSSIIVYMRGQELAVNDVGRNAFLIRTYGGNGAERACCS